MGVEKMVQSVGDVLFSEEASAYAVLDGASVPGLLESLYQHQPECVCLYRGELEPDMAEVAPYLVHIELGSEFADWVIGQGWGKHWGIFAISNADLRAMRQHFREFLVVYDNDGKPLLFRYYDPRVLRVYLPTCNAEELATLFGPVSCYVAEDDDPHTALCFRTPAGSLRTEEVTVG